MDEGEMDEHLHLQKEMIEVSTLLIMIYMTSNNLLQMYATVGMAALRQGPIDLVENLERLALTLITVVLSHGGRDGPMLGQPSM